MSEHKTPIKLLAVEDEFFTVHFVQQVLDLNDDAAYFSLNENEAAKLMMADSSGRLFIPSKDGMREWDQIGSIGMSHTDNSAEYNLVFKPVEGFEAPACEKVYSARDFEMYLDFEGVVLTSLMKIGVFKYVLDKHVKEPKE